MAMAASLTVVTIFQWSVLSLRYYHISYPTADSPRLL